jgi:hypothetical protein
MEEDRDLEELVKAIEKGDKERAVLIAKTLFKRRMSNNPDPVVINWFGLLILAIVILSPFLVTLAELWLKRKLSSKEEKIYA